jgi:hypothetical protein
MPNFPAPEQNLLPRDTLLTRRSRVPLPFYSFFAAEAGFSLYPSIPKTTTNKMANKL